MKKGTIIFLGLIFAGAALIGPMPINAAKNKGVIQVETRLIQVNVVARDSRGRPVRNLKKSDFRLFDNGKPVPIDIFSTLSAPVAKTPKPLPPGVYSNRVRGASSSITVVLLDGLNTQIADQAWARTAVVKFLEEIKPQDHVGIMLLGSRLFVLQNFTSDPKILLAALKNAPITSPKEVEGSEAALPPGVTDRANYNLNGSAQLAAVAGLSGQQLNNLLAQGAGGGVVSDGGGSRDIASAAGAEAQYEQLSVQFQQHESAFFRVDRAQRTLDALTAIANYLAQFPGRKNLIWVSGSFPIDFGFDTPRMPGDTRDQIDFTQQFRRAYKALNNADLAVYPVDARGLTAAVPGGADMNSFYETVGTMKEIAANTGGQAFYNTNDIARVMQAAVDDSDANYTIGFYPQNIRWDGKYHDLKLKLDRPGIHLRYRRGYIATQQKPKGESKSEYALNRAIYDPLDSTGLGLTVKILKFQHVPEGRVLLAMNMDARDMMLQPAGGSRTTSLSVVLAQLNKDGTVLHTGGYDMKLRVADAGVPRLAKSGLGVAKWVTLVKGAKTLTLVVRDPASENVGSVRIPLGNW